MGLTAASDFGRAATEDHTCHYGVKRESFWNVTSLGTHGALVGDFWFIFGGKALVSEN